MGYMVLVYSGLKEFYGNGLARDPFVQIKSPKGQQKKNMRYIMYGAIVPERYSLSESRYLL